MAGSFEHGNGSSLGFEVGLMYSFTTEQVFSSVKALYSVKLAS